LIGSHYAHSKPRAARGTIGLSGGLSAFYNDVVCVALNAVGFHLARKLKFDPNSTLNRAGNCRPNVGSTGTITGIRQNIYIGAHSGISYLRSPPADAVTLLGLGLTYVIVCLVYRRPLAVPKEKPVEENHEEGRPHSQPTPTCKSKQ